MFDYENLLEISFLVFYFLLYFFYGIEVDVGYFQVLGGDNMFDFVEVMFKFEVCFL